MKIGCGFWMQWLLVTVVGFLVSLCWIEVGIKPHTGLMVGAIGGAVIGLAQGLLLWRRVKKIAYWWILATTISWSLIAASNLSAIGWVAPRMLMIEPRVISGIFFGGQVGAWLGVGQWFVLRQQVKGAITWIWVSSLAWVIGLPSGWAVGGVLRLKTHLFLSELFGLAVVWIIVAAITGVALIWLLRGAAIQFRNRERLYVTETTVLTGGQTPDALSG